MSLHPRVLASASILLLGVSPHLHAEVGDNPEYEQAYGDWSAAHLILLPTSFLPGPFGTAADLSTLGIDIRLRYLPARFVAPTVAPRLPDSPDQCEFRFSLPQREAEYSNLFNLWDIKPLTPHWGALGTPGVGHGNSSVIVRVASPYLDGWTPLSREVSFPSGVHRLEWRADTQLDPILDVAVPTALFVINAELKYGKAITQTDPKSAARAFAIGKEFLLDAAIEAGLIAAGEVNDLTLTSASHQQERDFTVLDVRPPEIATSLPYPPPIEATGFGGERWSNHFAALRATIDAFDPCGLDTLLGHDAPDFLPIGTTTVTWTAFDTGPLGGGNPGEDSVQQHIVVQDTLAPILLAPPSRVVESNSAPAPAAIDIGTAVVFDLADADPQIGSTAPSSFPVNSRTEVRWTATDDAGNSAQKSQWVTVKTPGSNTPPQVANVAAQTLTSQPVDIVLSGSDGDLLSGRFDPLKFRIVERPANGFFVSPLMPYFIEDYRVRPNSEVGAILNVSGNPPSDLDDAFCRDSPPRPIPVDFVYRAKFVHVRDDDVSFVLDEAWRCTSGLAVTDRRISKWNADGALIGSTSAAFGFREVNRVTLDSDEMVQAVSPSSASEWLVLRRYAGDLSTFVSWELRDTRPLNIQPRHVAALYEPRTGLIYATDKRYLYVYDGNAGGTQPPYVGALNGGVGFLSQVPSAAGSNTAGFTMEIDSSGALYLPDPGTHRIYKFSPSDYDGTTFTPGALVGWMGRCDSGPNCDDANGRSFGYSCTDATCSVASPAGNGPGQFSTPLGMALDPADTLYVTDYDNFRVQRFSPLGDFAGEAASTCDGSCFVLGDMGRPVDVSVNAAKFHVLDRDRALMHVFETAPFRDITESSVTLAYASDNRFQGVDTFRFLAEDGLAASNAGTASITVQRNFRPPEAQGASFTLDEDTSQSLSLSASDPDGILGIDFNGLDTLSYEIVEPPLFGTLSGTGSGRVYTPAADFSGSDRLRFKVGDGVFESAVAEVHFEVEAVNDPPQVSFTDAQSKLVPAAAWPLLRGKIAGSAMTAGRGFPLPLLAEFTDPDPGQPHTVQIDWGDGAIESADDVTPMDPDADPRPPVITSTHAGVGLVVADHVYLDPGVRTITLTVGDDANLLGEVETTVEVIDMVDLGIEETSQDPVPVPPGTGVTLHFELANAVPRGGVPGIDATGVIFEGKLPPGVLLVGASPSQGSCTHVPPITTCHVGTLSPGATVQIDIALQPPGDFDPEVHPYLVDARSNEPDASGENLLGVPLPVQTVRIFASGFDD